MSMPVPFSVFRVFRIPSQFRVLILSAALLILGPIASPVNANEPTPFPDLKRVLEAGVLKVAVINQDVPGLITEDADGNLGGLDIALAKAIADSLGVTATFVRTADTYDEVVADVANGEADIATSFLSRTASRSKYVFFSQPYLDQKQTVLINRLKGVSKFRVCPSVQEIIEIAKWPGQLGVLKGSSFAQRVKQAVPEGTPAEFDSNFDLMAASFNGDIVVSYQGELWAQQFLSNNPAYRIRLRICPIGDFKDAIAVAVRPDAPNLLTYINTFLDQRRVKYTVDEVVSSDAEKLLRGY